MITKKDAVKFARGYKWTAEDAKRAYEGLNLNESTEEDLLVALISFAGPELLKRQRLQATQRGLATEKKNQLQKIEQDYVQKMEESDRRFQEMRSAFIPVISNLYGFGKRFGLYDPWIEALLEMYEQYVADNQPEAS